MLKLYRHKPVGLITLKLFNGQALCTKPNSAPESNHKQDESNESFRALQLVPSPFSRTKQSSARTQVTLTPMKRQRNVTEKEDWSITWPTAQTFHPDIAMLPLRQGWVKGKKLTPSSRANAELMKIPNFLHLTPPAIKKHCDAIKKFCTEWPKGLETEEKCYEHFPLEIITSDYCFSACTVREPLARIVSFRVRLSSLDLNYHAKDKLLRLLGDKYNPETDLITITADRCPVRKQNLDYLYYLLTALYHESWRVQPWESEKSLADAEEYDWENNKSKITLVEYLSWPHKSVDFDTNSIPSVTEYKEAVTDLINNGEDKDSVNRYKNAVIHVLQLDK